MLASLVGDTAGVGERRRRGAGFWVGIGLVLAGLAVLGYVGWQLWGTNWVSQRKHEQTVGDLQRLFERDEQPGAQTAQTVRTEHGTASAIVRIPEFGDDYAVPLLEGIGDPVLAEGFGHFPDSAAPGETGNFALAGHRVTHGEPLRRMPELEPGDEVVVETAEATYTYVLTSGGDDLRVTFRDGWVVEPLPRNPQQGGVQPKQEKGQRLLTLTTCAELFHTDDRLVAFGVLESVSRRR